MGRCDRRSVPLLLLLALAGCAAPGAARPASPAPLLHLVSLSLAEPDATLLDELQADCDRVLTGIPTVISYASGRHLETGRSEVVADYDLLLFIGFADAQGYRAYSEHPAHVALVDEWRDRLSSLVVRDVLD